MGGGIEHSETSHKDVAARDDGERGRWEMGDGRWEIEDGRWEMGAGGVRA
jgi:hypothetical protein